MQKRRGTPQLGDPPWGVSSWTPLLGMPVLGLHTGKMSPLGLLKTSESRRRARRDLESTHKEQAHTW